MTEAINEAILSGHSCQMDSPEHDFFAIDPLDEEQEGF